MAGVFKSIDRSDIRLTAFRAHKLISLSGSGELANYTYLADYNPVSSHDNADPLNDNFDIGNSAFVQNEPTTSFGFYRRVIHRSLDHLYYRDFYTNTRATFGGGNINYQHRLLEDKATVISIPQTKFGEQILPGSVRLYVTYSFGGNSLILADDGYGNLYPSGGISTIPDGKMSSSISHQLMGEWPSSDVYKYIGEGMVSFKSDHNQGFYSCESRHHNLTATQSYSASVAQVTNMIGATFRFSSSLNSRIEAGNFEMTEYNYSYNFPNGDFTITALIKPEAEPIGAARNIVVTKAGPNHRLQLDINGNLFTESIDRRTPYSIYLSGSEIVFERDALYESVRLVASYPNINEFYHIAAIKTGSNLELWLNGAQAATAVDVSNPADCSNFSNIFIGNSYDNQRPFTGLIDSVKIYKGAFTAADVSLSYRTQNAGNVYVGNVFYNNGMIVLTSGNSRYFQINQVDLRATQTIYETEIACTVGPGEFNRSVNRSLQVYNPETNQFEFKPFATGSSFRPYVTTIGLYNENHQLVALGKLSTPIQLPTNVDTTFIVKYDKW